MQVSEDTTVKGGNTIIPFPFIFYTPETSTGFGAIVAAYFRLSGDGPNDRPSYISPVVVYTLKKQSIVFVEGEVYWGDGGLYRLNANIGYSRFPNTFWGVGNDAPDSAEEDYTPRQINAEMQMQRRVVPGLYFGGMVQVAHRKLLETKQGGLLATRAIPGTRDGRVVAGGFLITSDTRNNTVYPRSGGYRQLRVLVYDGALGSDYDFGNYSIDLRQYVTVFSTHVLAFWGLANASTGTPPFDLLPQLGGESLLRGYFQGRYRDRDLVAFQAEYRAPVWWRFGVVGFAGVGRVSHDFGGLELDGLHAAAGWGIRFLLSRDEGLNLRADWGFAEGSSGFYLGIGEAF